MNLPDTKACSLNVIYNTLHSKLRMLMCCKKNKEKELKNTSNSIISADNMTGEIVKLSLRSENFSKIYVIYLHLSFFFCTFARNCKSNACTVIIHPFVLVLCIGVPLLNAMNAG